MISNEKRLMVVGLYEVYGGRSHAVLAQCDK